MVKQTKTYRWANDRIKKVIKIDVIRFGLVGGVGFIVTLFFKYIFQHIFSFPVGLSIFLGSEMGLLSNFVFHEKWTYNSVDHSDKPLLKKFASFQLSSLSGVVIFTIIANILVAIMHKPDSIVALVIAAGITMFWNYFWTKYFIFKGKTPSILMKPEETIELKEQ